MGCSVESCGLPRRPPILHLHRPDGCGTSLSLRSSRTILIVRRSPYVVRSPFLDSRFSSFRVLTVLRLSFSILRVLIDRSSIVRIFSSVVTLRVTRHVFRLPSWFGVWRAALHLNLLLHRSFVLHSFGLVKDCSSTCFVACSAPLSVRFSSFLAGRSILEGGVAFANRHSVGFFLSSLLRSAFIIYRYNSLVLVLGQKLRVDA